MVFDLHSSLSPIKTITAYENGLPMQNQINSSPNYSCAGVGNDKILRNSIHRHYTFENNVAFVI